MISNSAISKVFRQIAYLIEFEAKAKDEDMDNDGNNKTNAVLKLEHIDGRPILLTIYPQI